MHLRERGHRLRRVVVMADLERDAERVLQVSLRLVGLAEQEVQPAEVVQEPADVRAIRKLLVLRLCALRVRPRADPLAVPLRDQRGHEVDVADRSAVVEPLGELERELHVLTRGLPVALAAVAAGAPGEHLRAEEVAGQFGPLGKRERLPEEGDRGRDARELVAADADPEHDVRAVGVRELRLLDEAARLLEQSEPLADLAALLAGPTLAAERAELELDRARGRNRRATALELADRLVVAVVVRKHLGPGEDGLDAGALVTGDAVREEAWVDAEPRREPLDRLRSRARLAALDLADVLLREAIAGELRLRQARGHAQLAQALAEASAPGR